MDLKHRFPAISYLEARAKRRMPRFAWEFFDSGTGDDEAARRNTQAFAGVTLTPRFMHGEFDPTVSTTLFGEQYEVPFGVAPVGMNSVGWPGTDRILAAAAARHRFPYSMSTASNETPETLGPMASGMGWFQLYPPRNSNMRNDLLSRAREAGFTTLLVTVDVPVISRRERQVRAGMAGTGANPRMMLEATLKPSWLMATMRNGKPRMPTLERYSDPGNTRAFLQFVNDELNGTLDWQYIDALRKEWDGPLILKGVLHPAEALEALEHGADGILVSNHGGRQLDAAPSSITALPTIAAAIDGRAPVLLDSGVRSGLDIARAIALGADFVLCGRAFMYGTAALGEQGGDHVFELLRDDLKSNMSNLGCKTLAELRDRVD